VAVHALLETPDVPGWDMGHGRGWEAVFGVLGFQAAACGIGVMAPGFNSVCAIVSGMAWGMSSCWPSLGNGGA
jgi:hypothetical protein